MMKSSSSIPRVGCSHPDCQTDLLPVQARSQYTAAVAAAYAAAVSAAHAAPPPPS